MSEIKINIKKARNAAIIIVVVIVSSIALMKGLSALKPQPEKRIHNEQKINVLGKKVEYESIQSNISGNGKLLTFSQLDIVSEASGKIEIGDVILKKGSKFKKGQVLLRIYDEEAKLLLKAAKSRFLASVTKILPDIRIDFAANFATIQDYVNSLDVNKKFQDFPNISNQKLQVFLASKQILSDLYSIQQMELQVARYTVAAPFSGEIIQVYSEIGSFVNPGGKVLQIVNTEKFEVEVPIDIQNSEWIETGQEVLVTSSAREKSWRGTVARLSDYIDQSSQSRNVYISIINDGSILHNEFVVVEFMGEYIENVIKIPRNSIIKNNKVFCVQNGKLKEQQINIVKTGTDYALVSGIEENDTVVVEPLVNIEQGTHVQVITSKN